MPTKSVQRFTTIPFDSVAALISSQTGWSGVTGDDIVTMTWSSAARTVTIVKVAEGTLPTLLNRSLSVTSAEIFNALSSVSGWVGGSASDIFNVTWNSAGKKIIFTKIVETA